METVFKGPLIRKVARNCEVPRRVAQRVVDGFLREVADELVRGHEVTLLGLGTLSPTFYPSRRVRSFWRGHEVPTKVTFSVSFRRSKQLAERLDAVAKKPAAERR